MAEKDILLKRFVGDFRKISGVEGCVITATDGTILASDVAGEINQEELGAITVYSGGIGSQLDSDLKLGAPEKVVVEGEGYKIISIPSGDFYVGLSTTPNVSVDMISREAVDVASKIQEVI